MQLKTSLTSNMYYQHNLRVKLQEWMNRIYQSPQHFNSTNKFFYENIKKNPLLSSILDGVKTQYPNIENEVEKFLSYVKKTHNRPDVSFTDESHKGVFFYLVVKAIEEAEYQYSFNQLVYGSNQDENVSNYVDYYIKPIVHFLEDSLDEGSFVLHILEKYKFRTENFTKKALVEKYHNAVSSYEQVLEDDLRLYLFDQGIDNPFSTPKSASGRSDIIGGLDTNDPLVLEVKIFDKDKSYGKNRVISGFKQAVQYSNDYNKSVGYLVTFVLDDVHVEIENSLTEKSWPIKIEFAGKLYNLIFIYLNGESASKGKINKISITREDLTKAVEDD